MTTITELFSLERLKALGLQARDVQIQVARDVDTVLRAPMPAGKTLPVLDAKTGVKADKRLHRAACGLIEAGTGTGKTLGYLVPLLMHHARTGSQVGVSTFTRALQRQILTGADIDNAKAIAGVDATVCVRMGRSNFVCKSRVLRFDDALDARWRDTPSWRAFIAWVEGWDTETDPIDTTFMAWRDANNGALPVINGAEVSEDQFSLGEKDDAADSAYYTRHAEAASVADLVITNHATLLLHATLPQPILGDLSAMVIDEADRLPDAARSLLSHRLRPGLLLDRARRRSKDPLSESVERAAKTLEGLMLEVGQARDWRDCSPKDLMLQMPEQHAAMLAALRAFTLPNDMPEAGGIATVVRSMESGVDAHSVVTLSYSPLRHLPSFAVDPVDVDHLLRRLFQAWGDTMPRIARSILTSASLSNPIHRSPMEHVHHDYGIDNDAIVVRVRHEPVSFGRMRVVLPDPRVGTPMIKRDEKAAGEKAADEDADADGALVRYREAWLRYVLQAIDLEPVRRKLVLTPSFFEIAELLRLRGVESQESVLLDGVLYHQPRDPSRKLIARLSDPAVRAIVTPSFWEGVNLVVKGADGKDALWMQDLIITRMPIAPMARVADERIAAHIAKQGDARSIAEAQQKLFLRKAAGTLRKLRQAIGRGIRGPNDTIRVWLLDPRLAPQPEWAMMMSDLLDSDAFAQAVDQAARPGHVALQRWRDAFPSRFLPAVADADLFDVDGRLQSLRGITA